MLAPGRGEARGVASHTLFVSFRRRSWTFPVLCLSLFPLPYLPAALLMAFSPFPSAWLPARELSRLTPSAINAFISGSDSGSKNAAGGRKNGDLMEGYRKVCLASYFLASFFAGDGEKEEDWEEGREAVRASVASFSSWRRPSSVPLPSRLEEVVRRGMSEAGVCAEWVCASDAECSVQTVVAAAWCASWMHVFSTATSCRRGRDLEPDPSSSSSRFRGPWLSGHGAARSSSFSSFSVYPSRPRPTDRVLIPPSPQALDPDAWEAEHEANPPAAKGARKEQEQDEEDDEEDEEEAEGDELGEEDAEDDSEKPSKNGSAPPRPCPRPEGAGKAATGLQGEGGQRQKTKKSKAAEGEGEEDAEGAKLESDPEALKVREWRHKLQKTFLSSNKALPKEEEMPAVDTLFTTVESYEGMNIGYLTFSKIGKVMRHIHLLEPGKVPRDEEFKFRDRAKALVDRWHGILNSNSTGAPKENGHAKAAGEEGADEAAESTAMDVSGAGEGEGEGDLTAMDMTMDETA
ncbi:hypothetical protein B0H14DRAFT_3902119 [Mycena olivaceomarginata]|nr:hypothetical protein B0H14DRAFT_3902119 [Mycena olivaceomarginata]